MIKICFVVNSTKLPRYFYNCIDSLCALNSIEINLILDDRIKSTRDSFTFLENFIDKRFSNFKENPFEILDVTEIKKTTIKVLDHNSINNEIYDWIVFQSKSEIAIEYYQKSKNSILCLNFSKKGIKQQLLVNKKLTLEIVKFNNLKWEKYYIQYFKLEKGFKNNSYKLLFNYSIYLKKIIFNNLKSNNSFISKIYNFSNKRYFIYYLNLVKQLLMRKFKAEKLTWRIAFYNSGILKNINQPVKSFWADPFIIQKENKNYVYFEELNKENIGEISCIELNDTNEIVAKEIIVKEKYHLSFPNVFLVDDTFYMIPESSQNETLDIYKCEKFPFKWNLHKTLIKNKKLLDTTWIFFENRYWLFANEIASFEHDCNEKLSIFYADNLFSTDWTPHALNPVITDIKTARNSGNLYLEKGIIYRPAQNCDKTYGGSIVINEVEILTTIDYKEKRSIEILPNTNQKGMHTYNKFNDLTIVDYLVKV